MKLDFLAEVYPWTKALHIIVVIAWMAALLITASCNTRTPTGAHNLAPPRDLSTNGCDLVRAALAAWPIRAACPWG